MFVGYSLAVIDNSCLSQMTYVCDAHVTNWFIFMISCTLIGQLK